MRMHRIANSLANVKAVVRRERQRAALPPATG